jgi:hypothetical protein
LVSDGRFKRQLATIRTSPNFDQPYHKMGFLDNRSEEEGGRSECGGMATRAIIASAKTASPAAADTQTHLSRSMTRSGQLREWFHGT